MLSVTCVLTSFNRPNYVRQALKSLEMQAYRNFDVVVVDDSSAFDIRPVVTEFDLPRVQVVHFEVTAEMRAKENRLGISCNRGLDMAEGDLICFLCDDDYFYPTWFAEAARFFGYAVNADKAVCFGGLFYSSSPEMTFPKGPPDRFFGRPIDHPRGMLDHNQVVHRRFRRRAPRWRETAEDVGTSDGNYFDEIAKKGWPFHPVDAPAVVKRLHPKSIHGSWVTEISRGRAEDVRE